jgi:hypothetical protein
LNIARRCLVGLYSKIFLSSGSKTLTLVSPSCLNVSCCPVLFTKTCLGTILTSLHMTDEFLCICLMLTCTSNSTTLSFSFNSDFYKCNSMSLWPSPPMNIFSDLTSGSFCEASLMYLSVSAPIMMRLLSKFFYS